PWPSLWPRHRAAPRADRPRASARAGQYISNPRRGDAADLGFRIDGTRPRAMPTARPCRAAERAPPHRQQPAPSRPPFSWRALPRSSGCLTLELRVALGFKLKGKLLATRLDHAALR